MPASDKKEPKKGGTPNIASTACQRCYQRKKKVRSAINQTVACVPGLLGLAGTFRAGTSTRLCAATCRNTPTKPHPTLAAS